MEDNKSYVRYEDFGDVGDGATDDLKAIVDAHAFASAKGLPVRATDGATYYIGGTRMWATVKTNTNFGKAKFVIDDRVLEDRTVPVFRIVSIHKTYEPEITSLKAGQTRIDFPHEGRTFVRVENGEEKIFIRHGENANNGVQSRVHCSVLPVYDEGYCKGKPFAYATTKNPVAKNITTMCGRAPLPSQKPKMYEGIRCNIE